LQRRMQRKIKKDVAGQQVSLLGGTLRKIQYLSSRGSGNPRGRECAVATTRALKFGGTGRAHGVTSKAGTSAALGENWNRSWVPSGKFALAEKSPKNRRIRSFASADWEEQKIKHTARSEDAGKKRRTPGGATGRFVLERGSGTESFTNPGATAVLQRKKLKKNRGQGRRSRG